MRQFVLTNGKTAVIRRAAKADAGAILHFINTVSKETDFLTFGQGEFPFSLEQEETFLEAISGKVNSLCLLAEVDGAVIGSLTFTGGERPRVAHVGEVGISILQQYWGYGLGKELMSCLLEWCNESGIIRKVNLRVRTDNSRAIHLYKKLGFVEEGLIKRYFLINGTLFDSLLMGYLID